MAMRVPGGRRKPARRAAQPRTKTGATQPPNRASRQRPRGARPRAPGEPLGNARHERFCQELAQGASAATAYRRAGYKGDRTAACRMSTNVNISDRVAELKSAAAEEAIITAAGLIGDATAIQAEALSDQRYGSAVAALIVRAKLAGLLPAAKSERQPLDLTRLTSAERARFEPLYRIATGEGPREIIPRMTETMSVLELAEIYAREIANPDALIEGDDI